MTSWADRPLVALGGLSGCLGVGLAAMAAHVTGGGSLDTAARFLMLHAPALIAIDTLSAAALVHAGAARAAGFMMALGLVLFCGDLTVRSFWSVAPLPLAAPAGGMLLMAAWLLLAAASLLAPKGRNRS